MLQEYINLISTEYGSTGSLHQKGAKTLALETTSKDKIASLLKVKPNEIYFNSGATEGNNYAIKGVALNYKKRGNTIITTNINTVHHLTSSSKKCIKMKRLVKLNIF